MGGPPASEPQGVLSGPWRPWHQDITPPRHVLMSRFHTHSSPLTHTTTTHTMQRRHASCTAAVLVLAPSVEIARRSHGDSTEMARRATSSHGHGQQIFRSGRGTGPPRPSLAVRPWPHQNHEPKGVSSMDNHMNTDGHARRVRDPTSIHDQSRLQQNRPCRTSQMQSQFANPQSRIGYWQCACALW